MVLKDVNLKREPFTRCYENKTGAKAGAFAAGTAVLVAARRPLQVPIRRGPVPRMTSDFVCFFSSPAWGDGTAHLTIRLRLV